jgi:hypothetical protein
MFPATELADAGIEGGGEKKTKTGDAHDWRILASAPVATAAGATPSMPRCL